MRRAIDLAARVDPASVTPNPRVGAVVSRGGEVIGEGAHERLGDLHAERAALLDCQNRGESPAGAEVHLTLEPCAHEGRQPPCADALVEAGVARVVVASDDPSAKAAGAGPARLREAGIEVELLPADSAEAVAAAGLNQPFRKHARTGLPLVMLKEAMSLDGRIATDTGDSKWISGEDSRHLVHRWRAASDAVGVGLGTALADDPLLTARGVGAERQPLRVVFDRSARLPLASRLVKTTGDGPVLMVCAEDADPGRAEALRGQGVEVVAVPATGRAERVRAALALLGERGVTSLFLEGGPTLASVFLGAGEVDVVHRFISPVILGGHRLASEGAPAPLVADAPRALSLDARKLDPDVLITARLREW